MDLGIAGRTAIITGGARGIGAATARRLVQEGAKVLIADLDGASASEQAEAIRVEGGVAESVVVDVSDGASVEAMVSYASEKLGPVDILVNNAGFVIDKNITKMSDTDWDRVINVVLRGAFLCSRAVIPQMADSGWGRIINMSSRAHLGNPGQANYSAAKAGLLGFTRALALEQGRHGVTVNAVAPGIIATDAVTSLPHFEKISEAATKTTPIRRIGEVADIADAVAFLASDRAGYITGEVLHVTGGRY